MSGVIETARASATRAAGEALGRLVSAGDVIVLTGDLGAGKTVLAKGVADGLGVAEEVTSPTFNILLLHRGRLELAHFDLYRLERESQLDDIDFWGVLESGAVSLIEWGDRFPRALPPDVLTVALRISGDESRVITVASSGPLSEARASAWLAACAGIADLAAAGGEGGR